MKLLVTGAGGRLGAQIVSQAVLRGLEADPVYRHPLVNGLAALTMELTDLASVRSTVKRSKPAWIVHAAALTDVDACERDPDLALRVNCEASRALAESASETGARFLFVSTDYVFGGTKGGYSEADPVDPINTYGKSKAKGEEVVLAADPDAVIVRPSVLFGPGKTDFVHWVIRSLREGTPISLAMDQIVSPTYTPDMAAQILDLVERVEKGVWHTAGPSPMSRLEMGRTIAARLGLDRKLMKGVRCEDLPWVAQRPKDSSLDVRKIQRIRPARPFPEAVQDLVARQNNDQYPQETAS